MSTADTLNRCSKSTPHRHIGWHSINTRTTSWSAVSWERTNFHLLHTSRHSANFLSIPYVLGQGLFFGPLHGPLVLVCEKKSGHVITFLRRCGLQNTDHVTPILVVLAATKSGLPVSSFSRLCQSSEGGKISSVQFKIFYGFSKDAKCIEWKTVSTNYL